MAEMIQRANLILMTSLLSIGFIGCGSSPPTVPKPTGKTLYLYSALDTKEAQIYIRAFEEDTGIHVRWVRMSAGEVLVRLRSERNNPQVGLWFGGPSQEFIAAKQDGLLAPYKPKVDFDDFDRLNPAPASPTQSKDFELPPGTFDEDWYWTGFYFGALGFACNTEILKRKGLEPPTSWYDLLKPELKGEIGMAYAYTSGTSYTILATLVQLMGEESAFDYIAKLNQNIHHYNKSGSACVTQVGFGEIGVGLAFSQDILKKGTSKGFPVALSFPKEGTGYEIGAIALIKNGPNPDEAKTFIDWILSVKAQNLMQPWFRAPLHPKAEIAKGAVTADQVNLIPFDAIWAGQNKRRLIERWREMTAP
jgi:iron(III) transport system substrate-binding protein